MGMTDQKLHDVLTTGAEFLGGSDFYKQNFPPFIAEGLNPKFKLRPYQKEAFGRFDYYLKQFPNKPKDQALSLLFHMATGSGKTMIMAGLMLYLYDQGYRNFVFFVNSTNIINKTKENFLNNLSSKYLFNDTIQIKDRQMNVREIQNLTESHPRDINILFTTIQGLHRNLTEPKENTVTYEDFDDEPTVFLSDEAHHINAETKKASQLNMDEQLDLQSWERSVKQIFQAHPENIMLEFTATMDLDNEQVLDKYREKIIFDYPLREFRQDGYSKEVKLLQSDTEPLTRTLQALLLSLYRQKVFNKHKLLIKPVVLLKSNKIKESTDFLGVFNEFILKLSESDLINLKNKAQAGSVIEKVFSFFEANNINFPNLVDEIKEEFSADKCLIVNSKEESEANQIAVNSLEDANNQYRVIFAVDKLNEGWDVLNLFDIVRLYDKRDGKAGKPGKTTIAEAQLIGRGARYCPFKLNDDQPLYQRKYDIVGSEDEHELKICEELYYHSAYNPKYIDELNRALEETGIKSKRTTKKILKLKEDFKNSAFYKTGLVFINERAEYHREDVFGINDSFIKGNYKYHIGSGFTYSSTAFSSQVTSQNTLKLTRKDFKISDLPISVVKKAIAKFEVLQFSSLKTYYPNLKSINEFITSKLYLADIKIEFEGPEEALLNIDRQHLLEGVVSVFEKLIQLLQSENIEFKGSFEFKPYMIKDRFKTKELNFAIDDASDKETGVGQAETNNEQLKLNLNDCDWYVFNENYGTSEEKYFVRYIEKIVADLQKKYDEVFLIRNERHFQIYNFNDGKPFEPDFVLFLKKTEAKSLYYQVFIEPKGGHLLDGDKWKEDFLLTIKNQHKIEQLWENRQFVVWGMPFYNEKLKKREFEDAIQKLI